MEAAIISVEITTLMEPTTSNAGPTTSVMKNATTNVETTTSLMENATTNTEPTTTLVTTGDQPVTSMGKK